MRWCEQMEDRIASFEIVGKDYRAIEAALERIGVSPVCMWCSPSDEEIDDLTNLDLATILQYHNKVFESGGIVYIPRIFQGTFLLEPLTQEPRPRLATVAEAAKIWRPSSRTAVRATTVYGNFVSRFGNYPLFKAYDKTAKAVTSHASWEAFLSGYLAVAITSTHETVIEKIIALSPNAFCNGEPKDVAEAVSTLQAAQGAAICSAHRPGSSTLSTAAALALSKWVDLHKTVRMFLALMIEFAPSFFYLGTYHFVYIVLLGLYTATEFCVETCEKSFELLRMALFRHAEIIDGLPLVFVHHGAYRLMHHLRHVTQWSRAKWEGEVLRMRLEGQAP